RGDLDMTLPIGDYEIRVMRGPEYHLDSTNITLSEKGGIQEFQSTITRWVDMRKEGWYSGENHIHANYGYGQWYNTPRSMLDFCEAQDLHVANLVVANSDSDAIFDREFFRGGPDPLSTDETVLWFNEEFRSTIWGHLTLFHLKQLVEPIMTGFRNTTTPWDIPTSAEILKRTRMQKGSGGYTHPTNNREDAYDQPYSAKGLPVDAALGLVDCADFMGVVYDQALDYWYKLLNAGFRLPASAGTDCFLNRVTMSPPGWARAYVHLPDGFTYEGWVDGLKKGRSFVSNGPMLNFAVAGKSAGDEIRLNKPTELKVMGSVRSAYPLEKLELIFNGKVVGVGTLTDDRTKGELTTKFNPPDSGWIALRAAGKPVRFRSGRSHSAHTNPIYIRINGHPQRVQESARYFLAWIDRLEADLRQRDRIPQTEWHDVLKLLDLARDVYVSKLKGSPEIIRN
ncbi:MAG: CehA/McbA family metallohydrolase, partial [Limisphaerales bacterium]